MRDARLYPDINRRGVVELVLLTQLLVLWPLFNYLPSWIRLVCLAVMGARLIIVRMKWKIPGKNITGIVGLVLAALIFLHFGTLAGRDAGVSLIVVMFCMKLLEMQKYRDAALILYLSFFIMLANFLFSQSLLMACYMVLCILVVLISLQALNRRQGAVEPKQLVKQAGVMLLQAIPLMLILFLFFPRLSQPLWRMPSTMTGTTGISDSMTPGDIGALVNFDDVAFRVEFKGAVPESSELYWRGLVFSEFDGLTWSRADIAIKRTNDIEYKGKRYDYRILLEPHRRNWLYALEMPRSMSDYAKTTTENTWERRFALRSRLAYELSSYTESRFDLQLSDSVRQLNLSLPDDGNPATRRWAQQAFLDAGAEPEIFAEQVLRRINTGEYSYTMNPGVMAEQLIDDFWFNKQRGFCEHYAGAFVFLMRAAGIPARVVTGYQGGEMNPYADYMLVRQLNAHAWTEVWFEGRGWVRIDPTAAIHPSRVEVDLSQTWGQRQPIFNDAVPGDWGQYAPGMIDSLQLFWDSLNSNWQSLVIDFDAGKQHELLAALGIFDIELSELLRLLLVLTIVVMAITAALLLKQRTRLDPVAAAYGKLTKKLAAIGFERNKTEGPRDYFHRIIDNRPDLKGELNPILELYLSLRYRETGQKELQIRQFRKRVNGLKLSSRRISEGQKKAGLS